MPRPPRRPRDAAPGNSDEADGAAVPRARRSPRPDEPLAASWRPFDERDYDIDEPEPPRRERRNAWSLYGWRIYAVPLLIVITALAVFQSVDPQSEQLGDGGSGTHVQAPNVPEAPVVTEAPPGQTYDANLFSAELPPGSPVPEVGGRTFDVLPGGSPKVGTGDDLYRYTVEVEVGVKLAEGNDSFGKLTQDTLADPRSWTNPEAGDIALQRVEGSASPDFRVTLVSQNTAREICGYGSGLPFDTSCRISDRVYINAARWVRGAVAFEGDIGTYRRYAINHEVGHVFGNGHVPCGKQGGLAPVMMQQTFSTANNELHELNKAVPQGTEIPSDGFVCKYNAWPFPVGGSGS
ncbi:DUF3152 domain-containing protein [Saccharopolyspora gloriosae]|uniref:DUF3152 domain-containing protein n=1 Tax=Saccharopolyspora gloriosae TaxID=455344 RepID=UPI001FB759C4|nr:DUF3152 domain-containing protein [Saccharopolyspora gloriosae]